MWFTLLNTQWVLGFDHALHVREVFSQRVCNNSDPCVLRKYIYMSYYKYYHAPLGNIPNGCSTICILAATQSRPDRCQSLHRRNPLRRNFFFTTSIIEKYFLSLLVTKDNLDRCPVIHSWITPVPLDRIMARHTSGAVHSMAYYTEPMDKA